MTRPCIGPSVHDSSAGLSARGSTWEMVHHHFTGRLGIPLPNVSALLPVIRPTSCWDHMCWETLTHGGNFNVSAAV